MFDSSISSQPLFQNFGYLRDANALYHDSARASPADGVSSGWVILHRKFPGLICSAFHLECMCAASKASPDMTGGRHLSPALVRRYHSSGNRLFGGSLLRRIRATANFYRCLMSNFVHIKVRLRGESSDDYSLSRTIIVTALIYIQPHGFYYHIPLIFLITWYINFPNWNSKVPRCWWIMISSHDSRAVSFW